MHISVPVDSTMELINFTQVSPLVSKCQIKVCYVGENRNRTYISKDVATEMGRYLPGSPIVGFYNTETKDFEEHNREIEIKNGKFSIIDTTRPYGFVPTDAKIWFQKFIDDGEVEREYLVTEGYIWTGAYPESKRIIEQGNNQSMEITNREGYWSGSINTNERIFIINEALIEKLCILGENFEPCFEGSQIKTQFSLEQEFADLKNTMFQMINEFKEALKEGGSTANMENEVIEPVVEETPVVEEPVVEETPAEETVVEETPAEEFAAQEKPEDEEKKEDKSEKEESEKSEESSEGKEEKEEPEKKKYNLEEISEYVDLKAQYDELQTKYSALETEKNNLAEEIAPLRSYKLEQERKDKQAMIDTFYMLSDEDKADVVANIDTYSLDDIEAKLAVICVRQKVNFSLEEEGKAQESATTFSLDVQEDAGVPAWIKAVKETASRM